MKQIMIYIIMIFAAVCIAEPVQAQIAEVWGQVKDTSQQPVSGTPIIIDGPSGQTVLFTDEAGRWTLYNALPGNYSAKTMLPNSGSENPDMKGSVIPFTVERKGFLESLGSGYDKLAIPDALITNQQQ